MPEEERLRDPLKETVKLFIQGLGLLLVIIGVVIALQILFRSLKGLDNPSGLSDRVSAFQEVLHSSEMTLSFGEGHLDVGRQVAFLAVVAWTYLCVWISLSFVHVGAKLLMWQLDGERLKSLAKEIARGLPGGKAGG